MVLTEPVTLVIVLVGLAAMLRFVARLFVRPLRPKTRHEGPQDRGVIATYREHRIAARIVGAGCLVVTAIQSVGNAVRDWQVSPLLSLLWVLNPAALAWYFIFFKKPDGSSRHPGNRFWVAAGADYEKLIVMFAAMIIIKYVFKG